MLKMSTGDNPHFKVSAFEIRKERVCYTIETVRHFVRSYPSDEIFLIIGSDSLNEIHTWKNWEELLRMCNLAVVRRPGSPPNAPEGFIKKGNIIYRKGMNTAIYILKNPPLNVSSTMIRELWLSGKSVRYLLPESVRIYIEEKKLWRFWL